MADGYLVGQGKVYIAPRNTTTGAIGQWSWVGDASALTLTGAENFLDYEENYSGNRVRVVHVPLSRTAGFSMDMRALTAANIAIAVHGNLQSGVGATVTGEAFTGYNGGIAFLQHPGVSAVVINKGGTPLVLGTDYTLDAANGTVTFLAGSSQVPAGAGTALTANYTYAANGGVVQAMTSQYQEFAIRYLGFSQTDGSAVQFYAPRVTIDIASSIALIGNDVATLSVTGAMLPAPEITAVPGSVSNIYTFTRGV